MAIKTIHLIRHAKSSWKNPLLSDFERPLNKRGKNDAPKMASLFAKNYTVDAIFSSSSIRTKQTAKYFSKALNFPFADIHFFNELYLCSDKHLIHFIKQIDNSLNEIAIINHNPTITSVANIFQKEFFIKNVPTCGIVSISFFNSNWCDIKKGKLLKFAFPKMYF